MSKSIDEYMEQLADGHLFAEDPVMLLDSIASSAERKLSQLSGSAATTDEIVAYVDRVRDERS